VHIVTRLTAWNSHYLFYVCHSLSEHRLVKKTCITCTSFSAPLRDESLLAETVPINIPMINKKKISEKKVTASSGLH